MKLEICMTDAKLDRICGVDCTLPEYNFRAQILGVFFETVVDFVLVLRKALLSSIIVLFQQTSRGVIIKYSGIFNFNSIIWLILLFGCHNVNKEWHFYLYYQRAW